MNLAITFRSALLRQYGPAGVSTIEQALDSYAQPANSRMVWLDDGSDELGLEPVKASTAQAVQRAIRDLCDATSIESVLIVGNDNIIPFWTFPNPVSDRSVDPDASVLTDNPYGATVDTLNEYLAPRLPVGRLPNGIGTTATEFADAIGALEANHELRGNRQGAVAIVNRGWAEPGDRVCSALPPPVDCHLTPPFELSEIDETVSGRSRIYVNLHGFADAPEWKGFDESRGQFFTAMAPSSFRPELVAGTVMFVENCYGALTLGKSATTSCAMQLLQHGVASFIGATGLAFGSHIRPGFLLENADELAFRFFEELIPGRTTGEAFVRARQQFRDDGSVSATNPFKMKTLLQFSLLGDSSLN